LQQPTATPFRRKVSRRVQAAHKEAAPVCVPDDDAVVLDVDGSSIIHDPHSQSMTARFGSTLGRSAARICALSMSTLADTTTVS